MASADSITALQVLLLLVVVVLLPLAVILLAYAYRSFQIYRRSVTDQAPQPPTPDYFSDDGVDGAGATASAPMMTLSRPQPPDKDCEKLSLHSGGSLPTYDSVVNGAG